MKKVAIIIVTYNAEKYLKPLLTSLNRLKYPKEDFRIFVIDNDSQDGTIGQLRNLVISQESGNLERNVNKVNKVNRVNNGNGSNNLGQAAIQLNVEIIENKENLGFATGNNVGMRRALEEGYDYTVLLNQDMEVDENWLSELKKRAGSDEKIGAVQSMILLAKDRDRINSTGERLNYLGIGYSGNYQQLAINYQLSSNIISYASGAAVLYKSKALKQVGLFDESFFMYHEDSDLSWRARLAGWEIQLAEKAIAYHDYKFNRSPKTFYWTEKNRLSFLIKNFEIKTLILIFPMFLIMEAGMLVYALVTGWIGQKLKSYYWVLKNLGSILGKRKKVQLLRKVRDKELKKYLVAGIEFGGLENPVLRYVANPVMRLYWWVVKRYI